MRKKTWFDIFIDDNFYKTELSFSSASLFKKYLPKANQDVTIINRETDEQELIHRMNRRNETRLQMKIACLTNDLADAIMQIDEIIDELADRWSVDDVDRKRLFVGLHKLVDAEDFLKTVTLDIEKRFK